MSNIFSYYGLNRTMCEVLQDMRKLTETLNFSSMLSLIEEMQSMANRMEAALYDKKDLARMVEDLEKHKAEIKELKKEIAALEKKKEKLK